MKYHISQINIARFRLPADHPENAEFIGSLDRVNAIAEDQPGFVWRLKGDGNNALDLKAYDDPHIAVNMSVWTSIDALAAFVYRNESHRGIMRRRREWFDQIEFHMALWWVPAGHEPGVAEGIARLDLLAQQGPTPKAFAFKHSFPPPGNAPIAPILDECA